ncbi:dihydrofolate reductase family protein [Corynebacterium mayonis]|uniref:dihydrofolate reductase family protein n=1 Tax=Corynebacterium mayonis TaxID=3062461 RepID=UPI00313FF344
MDISQLIGPTLPVGEAELRAIAATTIFGSFGRGGTSRELGNANDSALLEGLRNWADCVVVGAETVRAEDYGPSSTPLAVITASLDLAPESSLFDATVYILCPESTLVDSSLASQRHALEGVGAKFLHTGAGSPQEIINAVRSAGFARISCEGGPRVYASMLQADLVDVLHITVDPSISSDDGKAGLDFQNSNEFLHRFDLELAKCDEDSMLYCRYRRTRS